MARTQLPEPQQIVLVWRADSSVALRLSQRWNAMLYRVAALALHCYGHGMVGIGT